MNDGQKLADVVGAHGRLVVEHLLAGGYIYALILHHAGVAAAGGIDGKAVELGAGHVALAHKGHAVLVHTHHALAGGRGALHLVVGADDGALGSLERVERLVLRPRHTDHLLLAVGPIVVDAWRIALPHNVVFLFLCHRIGVQRYEVFRILRSFSHIWYFICIFAL